MIGGYCYWGNRLKKGGIEKRGKSGPKSSDWNPLGRPTRKKKHKTEKKKRPPGAGLVLLSVPLRAKVPADKEKGGKKDKKKKKKRGKGKNRRGETADYYFYASGRRGRREKGGGKEEKGREGIARGLISHLT